MLRTSALLAAVPDLVHGFTTRAGPGWIDPERGLDLGPGAGERTWSWVAEQVGLAGAPVALLSQVHGATVHVVAQEPASGGLIGEGDALVTGRPGLLLAVRVADCVPVIVVDLDTDGRPLRVAAVHAGWRGLAAGVIPAALAAMGPVTGRRLAAVGPCIGVEAYEVGPEVVDGVGARVPRATFVRRGRRAGRWQADLGAAAAWQLRQGGAQEVDLPGWCTFDDAGLHSFRRDGAASGRLAAVVGLRC